MANPPHNGLNAAKPLMSTTSSNGLDAGTLIFDLLLAALVGFHVRRECSR
jgi:hypothetical protein